MIDDRMVAFKEALEVVLVGYGVALISPEDEEGFIKIVLATREEITSSLQWIHR